MWTIWMRRRQVLLGTVGLVALALTPRGRLARAGTMRAEGAARWSRERFPLPGSASDANPAIPVSSKHARWVLCPNDGKFYIFGGDYASLWQGIANQSGVNATLAYDPVTRVWEMAYPFWGIAGEHYPIGMDEVAICWDSKRKLFWLTDGYQGNSSPPEKYVGIPTRNIVQAFDPATRRWLLPFGATKKQSSAERGGGQYMRSVYDPVKDRILGPAGQAAFAVMDCATGTYSWITMTGIPGAAYVSRGQTVHLVGRKMYWVGLSGTAYGTKIYECDVDTRAARVVADLAKGMYDDQDNSYIPEIDSFLIWTETPPTAHIVNRITGEITPGPPSPVLNNGTGYRPQHNNRHPSGVIVVGWSASEAAYGKQVPEYWHYKLHTNPAAANTSTAPQSS